MGRQGGLDRHLQRSGNNITAESVVNSEEASAPATTSAQSAGQARHPMPNMPVTYAATPQPEQAQATSTDDQIRSPKDETEVDFDICTTSVFFVDETDQTVLGCAFSDTPDLRSLWARARVAKIASKDTILLEAVVGDQTLLMQKGKQRDFEVLKGAIITQKVIEITIREEVE